MNPGFLIAICALSTSAWYVWHWDRFFNSDFAMIGLVGRHILQTGEQLVYVPKVNYQGLLIEGNLSALLFRLFGESPRALHLGPALIFFVFLRFFYLAVEAWFSKKTAFWATLLMCFSSPAFFGSVLRTQPNYGETFALGCFIFWCLRRYQKTQINKYLYFACFAAGFGFYLYSQIIFFVAAAVLSLNWDYKSIIKEIKWFVLALCLLVCPSFPVLTWKLPGASVAFVFISFGMGRWIWRQRASQKSFILAYRSMLVRGVLVFLIGYSPSVYFRLSGQGKVVSHIRLIHFSEELWMRFKIFVSDFDEFMITGGPRWVSVMICWAVVFWFVICILETVRTKNKLRNPFCFLGLLVVLGFLVSKDSTDFFTLRYVLAWQLVFNLFVILFFERISVKNSGLAIGFIICFFLFRISTHVFWGSNYQRRDWAMNNATQWKGLKPVADYLTSQKISWAYGDYWAAYLINFCTKGEVNVEPLVSNYLPFYENEVKTKERIGLILPEDRRTIGFEWTETAKQLQIRGLSYRVKESKELKNWNVLVLEKL